METTVMSLKLLIDKKANKVLFAEAEKDFVDFLFHLLSLPVGTIIKLLKGRSMVGCIGNVYQSLGNLKEVYMQPNFSKDILLNPQPSTSLVNMPMLMAGNEFPYSSMKFYTCQYNHPYLSNESGDACPKCLANSIVKELRPVEKKGASPSRTNADTTSKKGYVQGIMTYMISDDLSVSPLSMISSFSLMTQYNISQIDALEERVVLIEASEALELLKASFQSEAALTTVFLGKKGSSSRPVQTRFAKSG